MAKNNVVVAVSTETRDRLNNLVKNLNKVKGSNEKELTAKDFIQQAVEYFERNKIDPTSDVVAAPRQDQSGTTDKALLDKLDSILKLTADNALKVTAIGQGMNQGFADLRTTIETKQKRLPKELTDEEKDARDYQLQRAMDMVIAMSKMQTRADIVPLTPADVPAVASDKKDDVSDNNDTKSE